MELEQAKSCSRWRALIENATSKKSFLSQTSMSLLFPKRRASFPSKVCLIIGVLSGKLLLQWGHQPPSEFVTSHSNFLRSAKVLVSPEGSLPSVKSSLQDNHPQRSLQWTKMLLYPNICIHTMERFPCEASDSKDLSPLEALFQSEAFILGEVLSPSEVTFLWEPVTPNRKCGFPV